MRHLTLASSLLALLLAVLGVAARQAADTPKAADARKKLHEKVTVDYSNTPLSEVVDDLTAQVRRLSIRIDTRGGVSQNTKITYQASDQPLEKVLAGMLQKSDLGYIVIADKTNAYDGSVLIRQGKERGYPQGQEPSKATARKESGGPGRTGKEQRAKDKASAKGEGGEKAAPRKAEPKEPAEDDPEKAERDALRKLNFARTLADDGKVAAARRWLQDILRQYPKTKAAQEARNLLDKLNQ